MSSKRQPPICQLRISLMDIEPEIWRSVQVSSDTTLETLHRIIQRVMGWDDYHLHQFKIGEKRYGVPPREGPMFGPPIKDESGARLRQVISNEGDSFVYEYDFGDSWKHRVEVEEIFQPEEDKEYTICVDGHRACPPEDCGGSFGYARILQYFEDPDSVELGEPWNMVVQEFDPDEFDLERANMMLEFLRQ